MIKSITGGPGLFVSNGSPGGSYINMSNPSAGMMRYNGSTQSIEIYDGAGWQPMSYGHATVQLDSYTLELLAWAREKKKEEDERIKLAQSSPAIKDLLKQIEEKEEQLKIVQTLIKEEVKVGTS